MSDDDPTITKEIAIPLPSEPGSPKTVMRIRGNDAGPTDASVGYVLPVQDDTPLPPGADLVEFKTREGSPVMDCKTVYESPYKPKGQTKVGGSWKPMAVSHDEFASNWDRIFGNKTDNDTPPDDDLLN